MTEPPESWSLLLAEDDEGDAELVRLPFRKAAVAPELCVVATVREALAAIRSRDFDAVICDLRLRDGSGLDIVRHIRNADLNVPVLVLTGQGSEQEAVEAIRIGADNYFVKNRDTFARLPKVASALVRNARSDRERRLTMAELKRTNERLRDYAEAASDWFWETDADHNLTFVSGTDDRLQLEACIGQPIWRLAAADPAFPRERHEHDVAERRRFRDFVYATADALGNARTIRLSGKPFLAPDGSFLGYRGVGTDITEDIRSEEALRAATMEAEKANRAKSRFLAVMSHELRTPLNAIIGFSESLIAGIAGPMSEKSCEYLTDIREAGRHLLTVVNGILDLSKIEAGYCDLSIEPLDLEEVLTEAVQFFSGMAARARLRMAITEAEKSVVFRGDRRAVRQILINIISNAVKFTPPGGRVEVSGRATGGAVVITIQDSGIGIPADELAEVMKPFHQGDNLLTRKFEGTGLGLSIAKGLIEAHNGQISIGSAAGGGTRVELTFPVGEPA